MASAHSSTQSTPHVVHTRAGNVATVALPFFLDNIVPPLPDDTVPIELVDLLTLSNAKSSSRKSITLNGRWRGIAQDPADMWQYGLESFRHLKGVVQSILKVSGQSSSIKFHQTRTGASSRRGRREEYLPDILLLDGHGLGWNSIAAFGELRKESTYEDIEENMYKVITSMADCFDHDPRRRFLYAFTIENTDMRLWFCDRSQVVVSEAFNFITDHEPVVHFFTSIMFATSQQYGLDPTMKRVVGDSRQYDISVQCSDGTTSTFRTLELLACNSGAIRCSGTRVWKVAEMKDGSRTGRTMALKDSWIGPEQLPEGVIYKRLHLAMKTAEQDSDKPSCFLTVVCHSDVYLDASSREVLDCTQNFFSSSVNSTIKSRSELIEQEVTWAAVDEAAPKRLVHYRIVFQEVGKSLDQETSLPKIFRALSRVTLALREMHKVGWVHRDVSPGNILLADDGSVLLGDLEYAKKMGEGEEVVVGTPSFMAVEVAAQYYIYLFQGALPDTPVRKRYPALRTRFEKRAAEIQFHREAMKAPSLPKHREYIQGRQTLPIFRYNPLHDLESLWWIAVYFLVKKEVVDPHLDSDIAIASEAQREFASKLFRQHDRMSRSDTLFLTEFVRGTQTLPPLVSSAIVGLSWLKDILWERYSVEETDPSAIDHTCAHELHENFQEMFKRIANLEQFSNCFIRPFTYLPHSDEDNADNGVIWFSYNVHGDFPVQILNLKRSISATPSDPSIDYAQFQRAKKAKREDPAQAGTEHRMRPYLARRAKKLPTRR